MTTEPAVPALQLMCAFAVRGAFDHAIVREFEAGGTGLAIDWDTTVGITEKLMGGGRADVAVVVDAAMDKLVAAGKAVAASRVDVARSRIGLAVPKGAPHPDLSSLEALKRTLLAARSVCYSMAGASGLHLQPFFERIGIAEAVNARATIIPSGFTAEKLLSGEADIALQQLSELKVVPGVEVVGPLPEAAQKVSTFSAAVLEGAADPEGAARFVRFLTGPQALAAYHASGLDPA